MKTARIDLNGSSLPRTFESPGAARAWLDEEFHVGGLRFDVDVVEFAQYIVLEVGTYPIAVSTLDEAERLSRHFTGDSKEAVKIAGLYYRYEDGQWLVRSPRIAGKWEWEPVRATYTKVRMNNGPVLYGYMAGKGRGIPPEGWLVQHLYPFLDQADMSHRLEVFGDDKECVLNVSTHPFAPHHLAEVKDLAARRAQQDAGQTDAVRPADPVPQFVREFVEELLEDATSPLNARIVEAVEAALVKRGLGAAFPGWHEVPWRERETTERYVLKFQGRSVYGRPGEPAPFEFPSTMPQYERERELVDHLRQQCVVASGPVLGAGITAAKLEWPWFEWTEPEDGRNGVVNIEQTTGWTLSYNSCYIGAVRLPTRAQEEGWVRSRLSEEVLAALPERLAELEWFATYALSEVDSLIRAKSLHASRAGLSGHLGRVRVVDVDFATATILLGTEDRYQLDRDLEAAARTTELPLVPRPLLAGEPPTVEAVNALGKSAKVLVDKALEEGDEELLKELEGTEKALETPAVERPQDALAVAALDSEAAWEQEAEVGMRVAYSAPVPRPALFQGRVAVLIDGDLVDRVRVDTVNGDTVVRWGDLLNAARLYAQSYQYDRTTGLLTKRDLKDAEFVPIEEWRDGNGKVMPAVDIQTCTEAARINIRRMFDRVRHELDMDLETVADTFGWGIRIVENLDPQDDPSRGFLNLMSVREARSMVAVMEAAAAEQ